MTTYIKLYCLKCNRVMKIPQEFLGSVRGCAFCLSGVNNLKQTSHQMGGGV